MRPEPEKGTGTLWVWQRGGVTPFSACDSHPLLDQEGGGGS